VSSIEDPDLGALGGGPAFVGIALREAVGDRGQRPGLVVEATVDDREACWRRTARMTRGAGRSGVCPAATAAIPTRRETPNACRDRDSRMSAAKVSAL
jgi:hypothetical protein